MGEDAASRVHPIDMVEFLERPTAYYSSARSTSNLFNPIYRMLSIRACTSSYNGPLSEPEAVLAITGI